MEGNLTADTVTLGEAQQWKFIGNESDGYTITNKLGYTIYFKDTDFGDFFVYNFCPLVGCGVGVAIIS